jgi:hypothetical protein
METKICSKCKVEKLLCEYTKDKHKKDGLRPDCKSCRKEYIENNKLIIIQRLKITYIKDKEKRLEYSKKSYKKNQLSKQKYAVNYYNNNKVKINNYRRNKKSIDPIYKLRCNMSIRLNYFLKTKNLRKNNTTFNIIGCTPTFLKSYLEDLFTEGMSWNNHGLFGWHIDHKIPLSSAQTEEEILKLCHYTNLQPLWAIDNLSKGKQIIN